MSQAAVEITKKRLIYTYDSSEATFKASVSSTSTARPVLMNQASTMTFSYRRLIDSSVRLVILYNLYNLYIV